MPRSRKIAVTGASGFIGSHLCDAYRKQGTDVKRITRSITGLSQATNWIELDADIPRADAHTLLSDVDVVIHLAGRAHVLKEHALDPLATFIEANVFNTIRLAEMAIDAGVKRFVFVSSIGVNGDVTSEAPFSETSIERPSEPYAISKLQAEQALRKLLVDAPMELVIVRPVLVYGEDNPGNFLSLLKIIRTRLPLPLGCVRNSRSFIYVGNLVSALMACAMHPAASGQTYLVSDGVDLSTPELVRLLAREMGVTPLMLPVPVSILRILGRLSGRQATVAKLVSSLVIDNSKIRTELAWRAPFLPAEGLHNTVSWFMNRRNK